MIFDQGSTNYYEILEVRPDASAQDIRNAYTRMREAYRKDNLALYSVLDASETDEMQAKIEEAFNVLSDSESRRDYDDRHGIRNRIEDKIRSIDRVPPMEAMDDADLLNPPKTDFPLTSSPMATPSTLPSGGSVSSRSSFLDRRILPPRRSIDTPASPAAPSAAESLLDEIAGQTEWRGGFLRKVREIRRLSVDDLATQTKISKTYIHALEEEAYAKLPAAVFVRGFIVQIAKILKLPADSVAAAYMGRYKR